MVFQKSCCGIFSSSCLSLSVGGLGTFIKSVEMLILISIICFNISAFDYLDGGWGSHRLTILSPCSPLHIFGGHFGSSRHHRRYPKQNFSPPLHATQIFLKVSTWYRLYSWCQLGPCLSSDTTCPANCSPSARSNNNPT